MDPGSVNHLRLTNRFQHTFSCVGISPGICFAEFQVLRETHLFLLDGLVSLLVLSKYGHLFSPSPDRCESCKAYYLIMIFRSLTILMNDTLSIMKKCTYIYVIELIDKNVYTFYGLIFQELFVNKKNGWG